MITKDSHIRLSLQDVAELRKELETDMSPHQRFGPTQYVPPTLTDAQWFELYSEYTSISNNIQSDRAGKWIGLRLLGLSDQECNKLCEPKKVDMAAVMREVKELSKQHQKELRKYNREMNRLRREEGRKHEALQPSILES
jgi:hypothetical protein